MICSAKNDMRGEVHHTDYEILSDKHEDVTQERYL